MLHFGAVKCDLVHAHKAWCSIKMLLEIGGTLLNGDLIVQIRVKISSEAFRRLSDVLVTQTYLVFTFFEKHEPAFLRHVNGETAFFLAMKSNLRPPPPTTLNKLAWSRWRCTDFNKLLNVYGNCTNHVVSHWHSWNSFFRNSCQSYMATSKRRFIYTFLKFVSR